MFSGIEKLRRHADPQSGLYDEALAKLAKSIEDTLVMNIR